MTRFKSLLLAFFLFLPTLTWAAPYYGAMFSYVAVPKEPPKIHGFQFMLSYDPQCFQWRQFNIYFDGGYSFFRDKSVGHDSTISIYSTAPVIRFTFRRRGPFLPYLDLSIGIAYMNHTRLEDRNLGMHFSFQDRFGLGLLVGREEQLSIGFWAVHYSNAHMSVHNSGISAPVMVDMAYRFH